MGADDAYLNGFIPELSFQSVLQPLSLTLMNYSRLDGRGRAWVSTTPPPPHHHYHQMSAMESSAVNEGFMEMEALDDQKLKMPNTKDFGFQLLKLNDRSAGSSTNNFTETPINFFAASPSIDRCCFGLMDGTNFTGPNFSRHVAIQKSCLPLFQTDQAGYGNEQLLYYFHPAYSSSSSSVSCLKNQIDSSSMKRCAAPCREAVKRKRQRMSDKVRALENLLPWNRKMDTATMLEEAYKYVKFLQSQVRVLQAMPVHSTAGSSSCSTTINRPHENPNINEFGGGVLAMLNRQQLLEVVMNSPGAHTVLYSRGTCVYSMEQLLLLKKMIEKSAMDQILFPSSQY